MAKLLSLIVGFIAFLVMVAFLFANRHEVIVSFDPVSTDNPALAIGPLPMSYALLGAVAIGLVFGALGMWLSDKGLRRRAGQRKKEIARLKRELDLAAGAPSGGGLSGLPALRD